MVQHFKEKGTAGPPLDILQEIFYISESWRELSDSIIWNCWQHAGNIRVQEPLHVRRECMWSVICGIRDSNCYRIISGYRLRL